MLGYNAIHPGPGFYSPVNKKRPIPNFVPIPLYFFYLVLIFFLILVLRVGDLPTQESTDYASCSEYTNINFSL